MDTKNKKYVFRNGHWFYWDEEEERWKELSLNTEKTGEIDEQEESHKYD